MKRYTQILLDVLNKKVLVTFGIRFLILIFGFANTIITAHFLSAANRGNYYYIISLAAIIAQFCNLGLATSNTYLAAKRSEDVQKLLINSLWVSFAFTGFTALIVSALHHFDDLWIVLLSPAMVYFLLATNLWVGIGKIKIYNFLQFLSNFLIFLLLISAGIFYKTTTAILTAVVAGWISICMIITYLFLRKTHKKHFKFDFSLFKTGFSFSIKAYISAFLSLLVQRGGIFFITALLNMENAGYFSIAAQLNDTLAILPTAIGVILFPTLIKQTDHRWQCTKRNLLTTGILMFLICSLAFVLGKPFITLAFGERYLPAIAIFYWMLPGAFFYALIIILSQYLSAQGFPKQQVYAWAAAVILFFYGNYLLIPLYGAIGSAMALSITFLFLFLLLLFLAVRETIKIPVNRSEPNLGIYP